MDKKNKKHKNLGNDENMGKKLSEEYSLHRGDNAKAKPLLSISNKIGASKGINVGKNKRLYF